MRPPSIHSSAHLHSTHPSIRPCSQPSSRLLSTVGCALLSAVCTVSYCDALCSIGACLLPACLSSLSPCVHYSRGVVRVMSKALSALFAALDVLYDVPTMNCPPQAVFARRLCFQTSSISVFVARNCKSWRNYRDPLHGRPPVHNVYSFPLRYNESEAITFHHLVPASHPSTVAVIVVQRGH